MYLRLLLRASGKSSSGAVAKIQEVVTNPTKYPLFSNNQESAVVRYTTTPPYVSAFNTFRVNDFSGDNGLSEFFINTLNGWNDPRRTNWATIAGGTYSGIPSGYTRGKIPERGSLYNNALMNDPLLGSIMNYPELQFILAEAALKGYIPGSARTYYENGVNNAITFWGQQVPAGSPVQILRFCGVKQKVWMQKWTRSICKSTTRCSLLISNSGLNTEEQGTLNFQKVKAFKTAV